MVRSEVSPSNDRVDNSTMVALQSDNMVEAKSAMFKLRRLHRALLKGYSEDVKEELFSDFAARLVRPLRRGEIENFRAYVYTTVARQIADLREVQHRVKTAAPGGVIELDCDDNAECVAAPKAPRTIKIDVARALEALPGEERRALEATVLADRPVGSASKRTGTPGITIRRRVARAADKLKKTLSDYDD